MDRPNHGQPPLQAVTLEGIRIDYQTRIVEEQFGATPNRHLLQIECLKSLDATIDSVFEQLQKTGNESLLEQLCPYFGQVWPSARALVDHLIGIGDARFWSGKRVLELGCGLALPSLMLARLGAQVLATDYHPEVPRFLSRNRELNSIPHVEFKPLDWQAWPEKLGEFDWIIGSDILYERTHPASVAQAFCRQLSPSSQVLLADPARPYLQSFVDEMTAQSGRRCTTQVERLPSGQDIFLLTFL